MLLLEERVAALAAVLAHHGGLYTVLASLIESLGLVCFPNSYAWTAYSTRSSCTALRIEVLT